MDNIITPPIISSPIAPPSYWQTFATDLQKLSNDAQKQFGALSVEQLNWQPNADSWSIAQCLEHLIIINSAYFSTFDKIIKDEKEFSFWEGLPWLPSFFGKMLIKQLQPNNTQKFKAANEMLPASSNLSADIVAQFVAHQNQLVAYVAQMNQVEHEKIIITSPVASFVTYNLRNALAIITTHEQRHYQQALRVQQSANFPGASGIQQNNTQIVDTPEELHPDSLTILPKLPPKED